MLATVRYGFPTGVPSEMILAFSNSFCCIFFYRTVFAGPDQELWRPGPELMYGSKIESFENLSGAPCTKPADAYLLYLPEVHFRNAPEVP